VKLKNENEYIKYIIKSEEISENDIHDYEDICKDIIKYRVLKYISDNEDRRSYTIDQRIEDILKSLNIKTMDAMYILNITFDQSFHSSSDYSCRFENELNSRALILTEIRTHCPKYIDDLYTKIFNKIKRQTIFENESKRTKMKSAIRRILLFLMLSTIATCLPIVFISTFLLMVVCIIIGIIFSLWVVILDFEDVCKFLSSIKLFSFSVGGK